MAIGDRSLSAPARPTPGGPPRRALVAVLGGGLAGLAAAARLAERGVDVHLLEASERVGGRVKTLRGPFADRLYAEAGAEFIAPDHTVLRAFLERYGLLAPLRPDRPRLFAFGGTVHYAGSVGELGERAARDLGRIAAGVGRLIAAVPDPRQAWAAPAAAELDARSLGEWLDGLGLSRLVRAIWQVWTTIDYGVEPERLSLLAYARDERLIAQGADEPFWYAPGGLDRLPAALAAELGPRVHLAARAIGLRQTGRTVLVQYRSCGQERELAADYAIVALPPAVVRTLACEPALPLEQRQALAGVRSSHVIRVHLQFRRRFWNDRRAISGLMTDLPIQSAWDSTYAQPGEWGVLTTYSAGRAAAELAALSDEERVGRCLASLERLFPGCGGLFERAVTSDWGPASPAGGAYSYFAPGELTRFAPWLGRPAGRLHFAGEHTDAYQATMNGALASGLRAADEVLARLRGDW